MIKSVAAIGESMLELTHESESKLSLGVAGDTLNTATYLSRLSNGMWDVDYVTRLGSDWYSKRMLAAMHAEGIGTSMIEEVEGARAGLYLVRTDGSGERSFTYYRSHSPARGLFGPDYGTHIDRQLSGYDVLYLSAITLQILGDEGHRRLWSILDAVRDRGGKVVLDTNYRSSGWTGPDQARNAIQETLLRTDIALPTFEDEQALFGDSSPSATAKRIAGLGVQEVVVKNGAEECLVQINGVQLVAPAAKVSSVVDTTGAGDAFNAGYLAARFIGNAPTEAARAGHALASQVIQWPGAIVPRNASALDLR